MVYRMPMSSNAPKISKITPRMIIVNSFLVFLLSTRRLTERNRAVAETQQDSKNRTGASLA